MTILLDDRRRRTADDGKSVGRARVFARAYVFAPNWADTGDEYIAVCPYFLVQMNDEVAEPDHLHVGLHPLWWQLAQGFQPSQVRLDVLDALAYSSQVERHFHRESQSCAMRWIMIKWGCK
jgi:hypothetical protein